MKPRIKLRISMKTGRIISASTAWRGEDAIRLLQAIPNHQFEYVRGNQA